MAITCLGDLIHDFVETYANHSFPLSRPSWDVSDSVDAIYNSAAIMGIDMAIDDVIKDFAEHGNVADTADLKFTNDCDYEGFVAEWLFEQVFVEMLYTFNAVLDRATVHSDCFNGFELAYWVDSWLFETDCGDCYRKVE